MAEVIHVEDKSALEPIPDIYKVLRVVLRTIHDSWGTTPFVTVACSGYADEHIQIWHPEDLIPGGMPGFTLDIETGALTKHPDSKR